MACRGYILGGLLWFAVPFSMATTIGLAGLALDLPMSTQEIGQALVPPAVAYHLLGKVRLHHLFFSTMQRMTPVKL